MSTIVRYLRDTTTTGVEIDPPRSVVDPTQQWYDPDDGSYVGLASPRVELSASELLARAQSIHERHPITDPDTGAPYTDEGLEAAVTAWISAAGA